MIPPLSLGTRYSTNADADVVVYVDNVSGKRVILEVSIVTVGSDSSLAGSTRAGLEGTTKLLREREAEKRNHGVIQKLLNDSGNQTIFTPANGADVKTFLLQYIHFLQYKNVKPYKKDPVKL
jgi:hypothetical protein